MKDKNELSIYLHIPFCIRKCHYCDFLSFPAGEEVREAYVQALLAEIQTEAASYGGRRISTVFFGGGTPSLLTESQLAAVMEQLDQSFGIGQEAEVTLEANPGTVTLPWLQQCRKAGVNRLSIGVQSLQEAELALLGRIHGRTEFYQTFSWAREAGFSNINVDLMAALPGQHWEHYQDTLEQVTKLEPEHISAYSLIVEEGTPFGEWYGDGKKAEGLPCLPKEEEERETDHRTELFLSQRGYGRYEISNYARPSRECRHNIGCWKRKDYVGFGLGAASLYENSRWRNTDLMEEYLAGAGKAAHLLRRDCQLLDAREQMEEFFFLGLRLTEGVRRQEFYQQFGVGADEVYGEVLEELSRQGLLTIGEQIRLTPYGRDISNYVMAKFLF